VLLRAIIENKWFILIVLFISAVVSYVILTMGIQGFGLLILILCAIFVLVVTFCEMS